MTLTKKELFNLRQASTSLKDAVGQQIKIVKTGSEKKEVDGQEKEVFYLVSETGQAYSTISEVFGKGIVDLEDIVSEEGFAEIVIKQGKSKGGRDFIYAELI